MPWWQTAVVYQIYPRSFQDTDGDGIGDLPGITQRLPYLAETLGVDAIWISPFYPSPMADFGYDVSDYCDVDPLFGTLDDFDELLAAAHRRGVKIIVDWVPNHTSDRHPWFLESRSTRDNPKRDWYVWSDGKPAGEPPNNWQSVFGGPAWAWDDETEQYYLHSFLVEQPDLNWRNPDVRAAMFDTVRFWLDRGVDGIRIDVAHFIMKDPELRDNPVAPSGPGEDFKAMGDYDGQIHIHDKGHADVHGVFRDLRTLLDSYQPQRFAVGEIHEFDWEKWALYYGEHLDELHMPYNFSLIWAPWHAGRFRARVDAVEGALPDGAWPNYVLGNHDEARLVHRFGSAAARTAAMLLLTLRGTPTLYYGDEIGISQADIPPDLQQDPWGRSVPGLGRDGCRTPMQWDTNRHSGFSDGATTWLPLGEGWQEHNVAKQLDDPASLLNLYRTLLAYRRRSQPLRLGSYLPCEDAPDGVFAYVREHRGERVLVALNFSDQPVAAQLAGLGKGRVVVSTHAASEAIDPSDFTLQPNEGLVIELL